jgi:hypothetical protein
VPSLTKKNASRRDSSNISSSNNRRLQSFRSQRNERLHSCQRDLLLPQSRRRPIHSLRIPGCVALLTAAGKVFYSEACPIFARAYSDNTRCPVSSPLACINSSEGSPSGVRWILSAAAPFPLSSRLLAHTAHGTLAPWRAFLPIALFKKPAFNCSVLRLCRFDWKNFLKKKTVLCGDASGTMGCQEGTM